MAFEVVKKNFNMFGINAKQSEKFNPINKQIFVGFVVLFFNALFQLLYVIKEATIFQEYIEAIYMTSIGTASFLVLTNIVLQMKTFFSLIARVDNTMKKIKNDKGNSEENQNKTFQKNQTSYLITIYDC